MKRSLFLYACLAIGVVAIGTGLYLSGSPMQARAKRYDQQRTNDLQQITYAIDQYWTSRLKLPANLEELFASREQYYLPSIRDPRTTTVYEYKHLPLAGTGHYELCATFETDTDSGNSAGLSRPMEPPFWQHTVGRVCFPLQVHNLNVPGR